MTHLKSYVAIVIAVLLVALTTVQGLTTPGRTWSVSDTATVVLAVLAAIGTHFTVNADDTGLDGRAKAVVSGVIAVLIVAVQAGQPLLGHPVTSAGLTTALLAVVGALAVYAAPETTVRISAATPDPVFAVAAAGVAPVATGPQEPVAVVEPPVA